MALTWQW